MLGIIFVYLQKILANMNLNFNTNIFGLYGVCFGVNYWNSVMDYNTEENEETEHCLQFFFAIVGVSFVWYTDNK